MAARADAALMQVPARLRSAEATQLKTLLAERRGRPVALDFAPVTQVGTQCLQVLVAANTAWQADGVAFEIKNMSGDVRASLQYCGLRPSQIGAKETPDDA